MLDQRVEKLIQQILSKHKELTKEEILELIKRKKEEIGSGYLTDMGALYLVASDLNISLEPQEEYFLNQVKSGMKNVDVVAFFLFKGEERKYTDRQGKERKYRTMYLYYDDIIRAVLWDDSSDLPVRLSLKPSEKLKIRKCSVKTGRDGKIELHLNSQSEILIEQDILNEGRNKLEELTEEVSNIDVGKKVHIVKGKVAPPLRILNYIKGGLQSKAVSFMFEDLQTKEAVRVVLWDIPESLLERIKEGQILRIIGLNLRKGQYSQVELHGDRNIHVEILGNTKGSTSKEFLIFSPGNIRDGRRALLLLDEKTGKILSSRLSGALIQQINKPGSCIRVLDNRFTIKGNFVFIEENSIEILKEDREDILDNFKAKIANLKGKEGPVIIEATTLSKPIVNEIKTKNGEIIKRSTILIGDDTGEIKVYAWRENAELLNGIMPGERIILYGAIPKKDLYNELILEIKDFTLIRRRAIQSSFSE